MKVYFNKEKRHKGRKTMKHTEEQFVKDITSSDVFADFPKKEDYTLLLFSVLIPCHRMCDESFYKNSCCSEALHCLVSDTTNFLYKHLVVVFSHVYARLHRSEPENIMMADYTNLALSLAGMRHKKICLSFLHIDGDPLYGHGNYEEMLKTINYRQNHIPVDRYQIHGTCLKEDSQEEKDLLTVNGRLTHYQVPLQQKLYFNLLRLVKQQISTDQQMIGKVLAFTINKVFWSCLKSPSGDCKDKRGHLVGELVGHQGTGQTFEESSNRLCILNCVQKVWLSQTVSPHNDQRHALFRKSIRDEVVKAISTSHWMGIPYHKDPDIGSGKWDIVMDFWNTVCAVYTRIDKGEVVFCPFRGNPYHRFLCLQAH